MTVAGYRLWMNAERTMLVRKWDSGRVEVCVRAGSWLPWGPPVELVEEELHA